jgi:hypothetical protein
MSIKSILASVIDLTDYLFSKLIQRDALLSCCHSYLNSKLGIKLPILTFPLIAIMEINSS